MCETESICAMAPVSNFLPCGIGAWFLSLWFCSGAFVVFRCWSLGNSGGFCSLLATIQHLSNLILDSRLSILSFGFFRLHTSVNLNFNLIPLDSTLFGSGFLNGLWSVCFGSFPSVSVDKFGSGVAG